MSQLTTHILDTTKGKPAAGVRVSLFQQHNEEWKEISIGTTNSDGRVSDLLKKDALLAPGIYKLRFETGEYFDKQGIQSFFPFVEIIFTIASKEHYHIPLLISPHGYNTYRGS
ncbi:MAG TPA: hydroxyisourate hydrolase [Chitinophagaceae bacterium]|nr:hydroxyisourate hydrolase [Chitinophagaceae bacterium]